VETPFGGNGCPKCGWEFLLAKTTCQIALRTFLGSQAQFVFSLGIALVMRYRSGYSGEAARRRSWRMKRGLSVLSLVGVFVFFSHIPGCTCHQNITLEHSKDESVGDVKVAQESLGEKDPDAGAEKGIESYPEREHIPEIPEDKSESIPDVREALVVERLPEADIVKENDPCTGTPVITKITPDTINVGKEYTIRILGPCFLDVNDFVFFDGVIEMKTTFINKTELQFGLDARGVPPRTYTIHIRRLGGRYSKEHSIVVVK